MRTRLRRATPLEERLEALGEALALAEGRVDADVVARGTAVTVRAAERLGLGLELTVAALAGATGSGKSSLFNRMANEELAEVGVRRPTTGSTRAAVWDGDTAGPLLEWLGARARHALHDEALTGLVLLDLPDHDSTEVAHRLEVDRIVQRADLIAWVVDPQKYADAALHERYLRPFATHAAVLVAVFNHIDTLDSDARAACLSDLKRLLETDGLRGVQVLATSARTGEGIDELRAALAERVAVRRSALQRLAADLDSIADSLSACCARDASPRRPGRAERAALVDALGAAAGVDAVARAVAGAHRHRAALATGWPLTRWLRRLRPDPLRRFHLDLPRAEPGASSLPEPTPVQRARVETALRAVGNSAAAGLPGPWPRLVRSAALGSAPELPRALDRAVTGTDLGMARRPRWWAVAGALQTLLLVVAAVGTAWLAVLFGIAWLRLPDPPVPELGEIPLPTLLLLGGLALGFLLGVVSRLAAGAGARRRAAAARRSLRAAVAEVAERYVLAAVDIELEAHERMCTALRRAAS